MPCSTSWEYALNNKEEVIGWIINEYGSKKSADHLRFEAAETEKMVLPNLVELGHQNIGRFYRIADIYKLQGLAPKGADLGNVLFEDFIAAKNQVPRWAKWLIIVVVILTVLVFLLLFTVRRLQRVIRERTAELEKLSVTDRLTGLYNRVKLDSVFQDEFFRSNRYGRCCSVIIFDIDHFKSVNDIHGHIAGDAILTNVAELLRNNVRETDTVGRWGGEEFLVICPETDLDAAVIVAEKLRKIIANHTFKFVGRLTCSFGVAQLADEKNPDELLTKADAALYKAKNGGRNRVEKGS